MEAIKITITGADARTQQKPLLTCGMVGVPVEFTFDESWEGLKKTAVFRVGMVSLDVVDVENACTVPHELLLTPYRTLRVGVYGTNTDGGLVIPTVWAEAGQILPGVDPAGDVSTNPTLPVWQQIRGDMVKSVNGNTPDENGNVEIETDKTLSLPNVPADAEAVGQSIDDCEKSSISRYNIVSSNVADNKRRIARLENELFAFFVDGDIFNAERGMCWEDWLCTDYNYANFLIDENDYVIDTNHDLVSKKNSNRHVGIGEDIIPFGIYTIL